MNRVRYNKVIGIALGERSLLAAELILTGAAKPEVRKLAELQYPDAVSVDQPAALGAALAALLKEKGFTANSAVVGLPARWLAVKAREVPATDESTLIDLLRLQAEGEFSSELKDLVYDYAKAPAGSPIARLQPVLLLATPQRYVEAARLLCAAADLKLIAVTPTAIALGAATARASRTDALVLAVGPTAAELTAQSGGTASALRHLRSPGPAVAARAFVGELRRAVSATPTNGSVREMVLWDSAGLDAAALEQDLGLKVSRGDLPSLGITPSDEASRNGEGSQYAAAVALALSAVAPPAIPLINFLKPRLAAPRARRLPRSALIAGLAAVLAIALVTYAYHDLSQQQDQLDTLRSQIDRMRGEVSSADSFVSMVSIAQAFHGTNPRYVACLRDLTNAMPDDGQTYATSLIIRDTARQAAGAGQSGPGSRKTVGEPAPFSGQLFGKSPDQGQVQSLIDRLKRSAAFTQVKHGGTQEVGRGREVSFSVTFNYMPPKAATQ